MKKLTATYHAPKGDSKVVEMLGHSFFDGKPEEIELEAFQADIITRNPLFECSKPEDVKPGEEKKEPDKHDYHKDDKPKGR